MSYRPDNFELHELVSQDVYGMLKHDLIWDMFDIDTLKMLDWMKDRYPNGAMTVNSWKWHNVGYAQSGLRTKDSKYYSEGSDHSDGYAFDIKFSAYEVSFVREDLRKLNYSPFVRRVEEGTETWLHISSKDKGTGKSVYLFHP